MHHRSAYRSRALQSEWLKSYSWAEPSGTSSPHHSSRQCDSSSSGSATTTLRSFTYLLYLWSVGSRRPSRLRRVYGICEVLVFYLIW